MAYRFLLEVPNTLAGDANVAIAATGDAQVLVARPSHGMGIDDEYQDLSIAAQHLGVIEQLYDWFHDMRATRPESRTSVSIVLHNGRRFGLHESDPQQTIAAIRRDQPWVERSIPKIGEHVRDRFAVPAGAGSASSGLQAATALANERETALIVGADLAGGATDGPAGAMTDPATRIFCVGVGVSAGTYRGGGTYRLIRVMDLAGPEHFYHDVLGMTMMGRVKRNEAGALIELAPEYDHFAAAQTNTEADLAFLEHGPLKLALQRTGRATVMDYSKIVNDFTLKVEPALARKIKAQVLMRGYTLLDEDDVSFAFRDPYAVVWEIYPTPTE
ncbi:MAG: hypothetical protein ACR2OU_14100 [Thermomicrobiales bacterium]